MYHTVLYLINIYHYQLEWNNIPNKISSNHSSLCPQCSYPLVARLQPSSWSTSWEDSWKVLDQWVEGWFLDHLLLHTQDFYSSFLQYASKTDLWPAWRSLNTFQKKIPRGRSSKRRAVPTAFLLTPTCPRSDFIWWEDAEKWLWLGNCLAAFAGMKAVPAPRLALFLSQAFLGFV